MRESDTAVLILAAGDQERWASSSPQPNGRPEPKQLADVGQPLLARMVRQVRGFSDGAGQIEPVIVTHDPRLQMSERTFDPPFHGSTLETLYSTHPLWNRRTVILLGDVIYSPEALGLIMRRHNALRVFGRKQLQYRVSGRYHEIFGLSFAHKLAADVMAVLRKALNHPFPTEGGGKLREFYERWCNLPAGVYEHESLVFQAIEDWTEDIDTWDDYIQFQQGVVARGWLMESRAKRRPYARAVRS